MTTDGTSTRERDAAGGFDAWPLHELVTLARDEDLQRLLADAWAAISAKCQRLDDAAAAAAKAAGKSAPRPLWPCNQLFALSLMCHHRTHIGMQQESEELREWCRVRLAKIVGDRLPASSDPYRDPNAAKRSADVTAECSNCSRELPLADAVCCPECGLPHCPECICEACENQGDAG